MLTKRDKDFITRWEAERQLNPGITQKLIAGLPMAMLFGLPVLVLVILVQFYAPLWFGRASQLTQHAEDGQRLITKEFTENPEWYNRVTQFSTGTFFTILLAVLMAIIFFAYFRISYKLEMNEQLYRELKEKQKREAAAAQ